MRPGAAGRRGGWWMVVLLLGACRADAPDYLPFDPGWWWYYEAVSDVRGEVTHERAYVLNEWARDGELRQRHQGTFTETLRQTPAGIVHVVDDPREAPHEVLLVPRAPAVGVEWTFESELRLVESRTFAAEDRLLGRRLPLTLQGRVAAVDAQVDTPAGHFNQCLHLVFTGTRQVRVDRGSLLVAVHVRHETWFAPGVGLVKTVRAERADSSFLRDGHYTQLLRAFGDP